ncbi:TetR/AcrR family transcriptional regulator [Saccharopolyspora sp. TS4A08]|uniref:TetR/AcrR family transcriptional regulator n=1 Tax=Saccharopolyspora ipomoeae TaxID=3042027 RepID=A0ABT6PJL2_9PSEU|nr:TetR/AcrR family transcriptional regulator [Saccharopolyspora sp. TS4A08]MDI2027671.1 TetR/AcrR family transcriptional regulator [Saccharopolyspora sp. TS4A08]
MTGSPNARRRMSAVDRREQILDVTHEIVDADGFHAATPNRIAEAAGITRPVLYQLFGDLPGLFVALVDRESERASAQFARATAHQVDEDRLISTFCGMLDAVDEHPATWRLFLFPPQGAPPQLHRRLAESEELVLRFLQQEIEKAVPGIPDPEYTARMVHASGRELLQRRLVDPSRATTDRLIALVRHVRTWVLPAR